MFSFNKRPSLGDQVVSAAIPVGVGLVAQSFMSAGQKADKKAKKKKKAKKAEKRELTARLKEIDDAIVGFAGSTKANREAKAEAKAAKAAIEAQAAADERLARIVSQAVAQSLAASVRP